jgi:hypothetical protein
MRTGTAALTASSLLAAAIGFFSGWKGSTVDPDAPAAVCPMVRPELLDRVVPGHEQHDETFEQPGVRGAACKVKGPQADAAIAAMNFGRSHGNDPISAANAAILRPANDEMHRVQLADEAWYFLSGDRTIYFMARLGATLVQVSYHAELSEADLVTSAKALAQEVLAQR